MAPKTIKGSEELGGLIRARREELRLTIEQAALAAGIGSETWRRYESGASIRRDKVRGLAQALKVRTLEDLTAGDTEMQEYESNIVAAWSDRGMLTPRQALAILATLNGWADMSIAGWLDGEVDEPLDQVYPFSYFDKRVMMLVGENKAWAAAARDRCYSVAQEIERGALPCDRPGCYFDEVLIGAALIEAPTMLQDMPEFFERVPATALSEDDIDGEDDYLDDADWDIVSDGFDDAAQWDDWEAPVMNDHPLLRTLLNGRHPFTWFDITGPRPTLHDHTRQAIADQTGLDGSLLDEEIRRRQESIGPRIASNGSTAGAKREA